MVALARTRGAWPSMRHLALEATRGRADKAHAVGEWVQRRIHYTRERGEQLEAPEYTLRMQAADCDGHAILVAALLDSIGVPWRLAYWTRPGEAHVNTQARTGEGWINLETTEPRPMGWTPGAAWHYHTRDKAEDGAMLRLASKPGNKWWRTLNDAPPSRKLPDEWWRTLNDAPPSRKLPDGGHKLPGAERWWQFAQGDEQPGGVYCYNPGTGQFRDTPDGICGCGEVVTKGQVKPRPAQVEAAAAARPRSRWAARRTATRTRTRSPATPATWPGAPSASPAPPRPRSGSTRRSSPWASGPAIWPRGGRRVSLGAPRVASANGYAADIEAALAERGPTQYPCQRSGNYIECDESVRHGSNAPDWLVDLAFEDARVVTDTIGAMPVIGWAWNKLMDWMDAAGADNRRRRLEVMNQRARYYAEHALSRVFYLKIEDAVRALGYGPLLDFLGSREWLNWEARRPPMVRGDGYSGPPPTPAEVRAQIARRVGFVSKTYTSEVDRWTKGPQGIAFVEEEGPPSERRLIGGQGWDALIRFMAGTNRRGGTDGTGNSGAWNLSTLADQIPPALLLDSRFEVCDPYSTDEEEFRCRHGLAFSIVAIAALAGNGGLPPHPERGMLALEQAYAFELRHLRNRGLMPRERVRFVVNQSNVTPRPCPSTPAAVAAFSFRENGAPYSRSTWCSLTDSRMRDLAIASGVKVANPVSGRYQVACVTPPPAVVALFEAQTGTRFGRDSWCGMTVSEWAAWLARAGIAADPYTGQPMPGQDPNAGAEKSKAPMYAGIAAAGLLGVFMLTRTK